MNLSQRCIGQNVKHLLKKCEIMKIGVTQIVYRRVLVEKIMVHICSGLISTTKVMLYNKPPPKP